jgi:methylmalonyl-CoA mutase
LRDAAQRCIDGTSDIANTDEFNLLKLSIDAARVRATTGEISGRRSPLERLCGDSGPVPPPTDALRSVWGSYTPNSPVVQGAYSKAFKDSKKANEYETALKLIDEFAEREGRRYGRTTRARPPVAASSLFCILR